MTTTQNHKNILLRAYQCKTKNKFNIEEFLQIVKSQPRFLKLSQKGLYILYLCEMLLKAYITNGLKIRNFVTEFEKKEAKKRQRRDGGAQSRRRKTNRKNEANRGNKTLEELSQQSLSNPSNVQRPRINVQNRPELTSDQIPPSKQKSDQSNGSKDNSRENHLRIQLNKITEQLRANQETFMENMDFLPGTNFEDNSQSSSSKVSSQISNLSQKLKIFTNLKSNQTRATATRKKNPNNASLSRETRTKKKIYQTIDQTTFIEQTRASQNQALNYTQISHFDSQDIVEYDLTNNFMKNLNLIDKQIEISFFQKQKIDALKAMIPTERIHQPSGYNNVDMVPIDDNNDFVFPDYTMSQPTSAPLFDQDFFKQSLEIKDSQFDFADLVKKSSKDEATLFYQLLWRQQNGEIEIIQQSPQKFSMITVKHK